MAMPSAQAQTQNRPALPFPPDPQSTVNQSLATDGNLVVSSREALDAILAKVRKAQIESLCGPDNSQDVELYDGKLGPSKKFVADFEPSTGQLQWNSDFASKYKPPNANPGNVADVRWCTGTLIAPDQLLTAGHCFDRDGGGWVRPKKLDNGQWTVIPESEIATNMHVNFNYQMDAKTMKPRTAIVYPVTELLENRLGGQDYALVRLGKDKDGKNAGDRFSTRKIAPANPANNAAVTMFQHPQGNPKKVEAGKVAKIENALIQYNDLDTQGGSSGSSLINDKAEVVGIHILGGCEAAGTGFNKATPIDSVRAVSGIIK